MALGPRSFLEQAVAEKARFIRALQNAAAEQRQLLTRLLATNRETAFGREHRFSRIADLADYRGAVPIRTFQETSAWLDRTVAGERGVLTAADPILFFATTGTTGKPKTIPVTREYFQRATNALLVHWATLLESFPRILERDDTSIMLYMAPKPFAQWTVTGAPIHNPTCMPVTGRSTLPFTHAPWFPPPPDLTDGDRLYYLLRRGAESDVLFLSCLHPSRLQSLALLLQSEAPRLIEETRAGTVLGAPIGRPNPARADEIACLLRDEALSPRTLWPNLQAVSCWTGGSFQLYLPQIRADYGAEIFPQTSSSSEAGHITLPIEPTPLDGPLTIQYNFYEFIPIEGGLRVEGEILTFDQLELGKTYELVVTTCTGLYRYTGGDIFRVIGFAHGVPRVEFVGRAGVTDLTGEKVTEQHVVAAIQTALDACGLQVSGATSCGVWATPSYYAFVFEPLGTWDPAQVELLGSRIDEDLIRQNSRYQLKRGFGDLGAPRLRVVPGGTFRRYRDRLIALGLSATTLKERVLHPDSKVLAILDECAHG